MQVFSWLIGAFKVNNIIIADYYNHVNCINSAVKLYEKFGRVSTFVPLDGNKHKLIKSDYNYTSYSIMFFVKLLFIGFKFDYIVILTGPEHLRGSRGFIASLTFFIMVFLHRNKIVLNVRTVRSYTQKNNLLYFSLFFVCRFINKFTFESKACLAKFNDTFKHGIKVVTYIYYPSFKENKNYSSRYCFGLLGMVNPNKRDYKVIFDALADIKEKKGIEFNVNILGAYLNKCEEVEKIKKIAKVNMKKAYLTPDEMDLLARECSFFISNNIESVGYGADKGTGSFGDAIKYGKHLIIPHFTDPINEFTSFAKKYTSKEELIEAIMELCSSSMLKKPNFDGFNLSEVQSEVSAFFH